MELQISTSDLTNHTTTTHSSRAWHLVTLLLSIGRPATPFELAAKCDIFRASPEYVEFLCFVPHSPLQLILLVSEDRLVTLSHVVFVAVADFAARCVPWVGNVGVCGGWSLCGDVNNKYFRKHKRGDGNVMLPLEKKRLIWLVNGNEKKEEKTQLCTKDICPTNSVKVLDCSGGQLTRAINAHPLFLPLEEFNPHDLSTPMTITPVIPNSDTQSSKYVLKNSGSVTAHNSDCTRKVMVDNSDPRATFLLCPAGTSGMERVNNVVLFVPGSSDKVGQSCNVIMDVASGGCACETYGYSGISQNISLDTEQKELIDNGASDRNVDVLDYSPGAAHACAYPGNTFQHVVRGYIKDVDQSSEWKLNDAPFVGHDILAPFDQSTAEKSKKLSPEVKNVQMNVVPCLESTLKPPVHTQSDLVFKSPHALQRTKKTIYAKHKSKHTTKDNIMVKEADCKDLPKSIAFPKFESLLVEEEEGSGGYGTVYRARRKSDGTTFAIKYPHANAHKHHVNNELEMLERFGGRNFVIKYEGSVKSGTSDCFVLQYVEHDRPEVLKREIDVFQLQWYGYCMFKALASLHKEGVVHRDLKPGNFLFSCKTCKGFLIDFNLAKDLHQKYGDSDRTKVVNSTSFQHVPIQYPKSNSPKRNRNILSCNLHQAFNDAASNNLKSTAEMKDLRKKAVDKVRCHYDIGQWNSFGSQGADGSGLTSAKDVLSARIPSVEKLREPLPCLGRKELITLAHAAIQISNHEAPIVPSSKRKRVSAPRGNMNKNPVHFTPMPLHISGFSVCGASSLKRGEGKPQKGVCVGTKGFRAPEVLLRSAHQGPKVDVWSAGVTLLYLMTGRLPFNGDPEQNMKEIVKLRGSEDLWEVAKLHERESLFPMELLDARFLQSIKLLDWCKANTKRPDFLEIVPSSFIDLVDKCLTVNPRLRISAEEALQHEFFRSCHEELNKKRLLRQLQAVDSESN